MGIMIRSLLVTLVLFGISLSVFAQPARYVEGTHYVTLSEPVRTSDPNRIEVTEVFWYGCNHCYSFEPLIHDWESRQADDVVFVRSPGIWNAMMEVHAQLFYTMMALDKFDDLHDAIFDEIQLRGNYLQNEAAARDFFVSRGVSRDEFDSAWNSFAVSTEVNRAGTRMRDYGVRGVPNMVVNGKYRVSVDQAVPTQADMLRVVDYLVELERNNL